MAVDPGRLDGRVPSEPAGGSAGHVGQGLREPVDEAARRLTVPPAELSANDVHAALQEPANVGQVDLLLLGLVPQRAHLGQRLLAQRGEVVLGQDAVDAPGARHGAVGGHTGSSRRAPGRRCAAMVADATDR